MWQIVSLTREVVDVAKCIAIVEDEAAIRDNYVAAFEREGYLVDAYDAREPALRAFELRLPDLVVIDINLRDDVEGGFELCRELRARAADLPIIFLTARDSEFDAVYSRNSLLHIPKVETRLALREIRRVLRSGGLFFLGVYGGIESDGPWEDDPYEPKRHFTFYTDEQMARIVTEFFELLDFAAIEVPGSENPDLHHQRFILSQVGS